MTFEMDVALIVEEFLGEGEGGTFSADREGAFDLAADSPDDAKSMAMSDIVDLIGKPAAKKLKAKSAKFVEFDSANISHACAHYLVKIEGDAPTIKLLRQKYAAEMGVDEADL